ncbi:MAG: lysophospholipid acyltransferase family protein [Candidatus Eisenbacteria bacterium]|uniref:Lysophospholipid acyltransferase family protein n=1 Tax=Eiseniibacteriota bacterium TaxID=2212470 RepID=A0A933W2K1_UNCEI|nr:lysophospholipid acyltransferase family protein [Candidatus Eisenbacteria bacterium]
MSRGGYPWWLEPAAAAGAFVLRLLGRTWRVDQRDDPEFVRARDSGEAFVYAFWHARLLPLAFTHRHEGIVVLVSRHRDGQLITRVIEHLGFRTARGSSTRGGEAGVREMLAAGGRGEAIAITPDGPRGPAEELKDGLVYVAQRLGRRIVPIGTSSASSWVFRSWDRFRVPRPFARVAIRHAAPLKARLEGESDEEARARVQAALDEVTREVRGRSGEGA